MTEHRGKLHREHREIEVITLVFFEPGVRIVLGIQRTVFSAKAVTKQSCNNIAPYVAPLYYREFKIVCKLQVGKESMSSSQKVSFEPPPLIEIRVSSCMEIGNVSEN